MTGQGAPKPDADADADTDTDAAAAAQTPHMVTVQRRQPRVLTQTIRRPSTTYITYVTLGGPDPEHFEPQPTTAVVPPPDPEPTEEPEPTIYGSDGSLSSAEIGAILGSIIAFVALLLVIWQCMVARRLRAARDDEDDEDDDDDDDDSSSGYRTPRPSLGGDSDESSSMSGDVWAQNMRQVPSPPFRGRNPPTRPARAAPRGHQVHRYPTMRVAYGDVPHNIRPPRPRPP